MSDTVSTDIDVTGRIISLSRQSPTPGPEENIMAVIDSQEECGFMKVRLPLRTHSDFDLIPLDAVLRGERVRYQLSRSVEGNEDHRLEVKSGPLNGRVYTA